MSASVEKSLKPEILKVTILNLQVCVPEDWDKDEIERWANIENWCGTRYGWQVTDNPDLKPVACEERSGFQHVVLDA